MRLILHPNVILDVQGIMAYYEAVGSRDLAEAFYDELEELLRKAADHPATYLVRSGDLRRVNLDRFPYNFLYRIVDGTVRVLVVRHHSRDPSFGVRRRWSSEIEGS